MYMYMYVCTCTWVSKEAALVNLLPVNKDVLIRAASPAQDVVAGVSCSVWGSRGKSVLLIKTVS